MKSRKTYQTTLHDLRDIDPAKFAEPSDSVTISDVSFNTGKVRILPPGGGVHATGQATPE
jgi:hypothetical protein